MEGGFSQIQSQFAMVVLRRPETVYLAMYTRILEIHLTLMQQIHCSYSCMFSSSTKDYFSGKVFFSFQLNLVVSLERDSVCLQYLMIWVCL